MKFKVNSAELVSVLKVVTKGFDSRDDSSFVYIKLEGDKLNIVSRCQSAYFSGSVPVTNVEVDEAEAKVYYVDGDVLKRLSGIFPTVPINLDLK